MTELKQELKARIIQHLNLQDRTVESIADDTPLFGEGLGLDSIDVLELIVLMDRHYGVRISDPQQGREVFQNVTTMAERILAEPAAMPADAGFLTSHRELNPEHLDPLYLAAVQAVEEAVVNAIVAGRDKPTFKPVGFTCHGIDTEKLAALFRGQPA